MTADRRPTLRALAKSRDCVAHVYRPQYCSGLWTAHASRTTTCVIVADARGPTRRAATEGLRAALEAMPEVKVKP